MFREDVLLYPVNPKQLARYRESYPGGGKITTEANKRDLTNCFDHIDRRCQASIRRARRFTTDEGNGNLQNTWVAHRGQDERSNAPSPALGHRHEQSLG